jgi:hypothetical protein
MINSQTRPLAIRNIQNLYWFWPDMPHKSSTKADMMRKTASFD